MKTGDIIKEEDISADGCSCCQVHDKAYEVIQDHVICPSCNESIEGFFIKWDEWTVVGEANFYDKDHAIGKYPVEVCPNCDEYIALMPQQITWNANHDVYYTGGKEYLNDKHEGEIFDLAQKKIEASIHQWKTRYDNGEKILTEWQLALWIKRDITHSIAEYLYKKGLKK